MGVVNYTVPAERDLIDIWLYIAEEDMEAADTLIDRIYSLCVKLASTTNMGRLRPEFGDRVRSFGTASYTINYVPTEDGIEILRVVNNARDIRKLF